MMITIIDVALRMVLILRDIIYRLSDFRPQLCFPDLFKFLDTLYVKKSSSNTDRKIEKKNGI